MESVRTGMTGATYLIQKEQKFVRDVSALLAVIFKILSIVVIGVTFYGVYKIRTATVSSLFLGLNTKAMWVFLVGGLLTALFVFACGHVFTMMVSLFDRQAIVDAEQVTDVVSRPSSS